MLLADPASSYKSLGYQAYERLREAIISLTLEPGQSIIEIELAEQLKISRTPIREALQLLANEQLLQLVPQRTRSVSLISAKKIKEISFVRYSLECSAFVLVAQQWDVHNVRYQVAEQKLNELLTQLKQAEEQQNIVALLQLDDQFQERILKLADNDTLLEINHHIRGHLNRFRCLLMKHEQWISPLTRVNARLLALLRNKQLEDINQQLVMERVQLEQQILTLRSQFPYYFQD